MATTMPSAFDRTRVGTTANAGNNSVKLAVNNASTNTNNIANVAGRGGGGSGGSLVVLPFPIPGKQNAAPPPPQLYMPVPIKPGPITYPLSGFESPGDVQTILNQPAAVILGENNVAAGYAPPTYASASPSPLPASGLPSALPLPPVPSLLPQQENDEPATPWYKRFDIIIPTILGLLILAMTLNLWANAGDTVENAPISNRNGGSGTAGYYDNYNSVVSGSTRNAAAVNRKFNQNFAAR